ncbi:MAG: DUF2065 domain-containing protein [Alphaproteobacteria bacterium]
MNDLWAALGLVLVIEGLLYAAAPDGMKRMMAQAHQIPSSVLRAGGLAAAFCGVLIVWAVRG